MIGEGNRGMKGNRGAGRAYICQVVDGNRFLGNRWVTIRCKTKVRLRHEMLRGEMKANNITKGQ